MKYHIERETLIEASLEEVKALVGDFTKWNRWSPWTISEPDCPMTYEGSPSTVGHKMIWNGQIIGSGEQEIVEVTDSAFSYDLTFLAPFKSKAKTSFVFEEVDGKTRVAWTMDSQMPFFLFFMYHMMVTLIEMDYDRGLRMLKEIAEKGSVDAETKNNGIQPFEGFSYVGIKRRVTMGEMKEQMPKDFERIIDELVKKRGKSARHWVALYPKFHAKTREMTYIAAISDEELEGESLGDDFVRGTIASGPALEITHRGSFDFIGNAWSMGMMFVRAKRMKQRGAPFEYYRNSPLETPERELKTSIYFPVKE